MRIKRKLQYLLLACSLILTAASIGQAEPYDYPIADPIAATILSTPIEAQADLPKNIRAKYYQSIDIFPERQVPDVFWYNKELRYSVAYHKERSPVMFLIAGTGAGYDSAKMKMMQKAFFQAGFHVVAISSPTHPNFIVAASSSGMPGDIRSDAEDIYNVMEKIIQQVGKKDLIGDFYITGYSLGGSQAAFVAKLDEAKKIFNFKKVMMINPALNIYDSAVKLDKMLVDNIPGGLDKFNDFYEKLIHNVSETYVHGDFIELSFEFFYSAYDKILPSQKEAKAVIGLSFRLSLTNLLFVSDVMTNSGYIVPKNLKFFKTDSLTDYCKIASRCSFSEYAKNIIYPVYKAKNPGLSLRELVDRSSLKTIEDYLKQSDKIGMVTNIDDFILAPDDIEYFRRVFGGRVKIYPRGGHCGNMAYKDNVAYMIDFFKK
ncbi:MAG TPA: alpha/beta hydrolase [Desulfarculaceae bacterium]|nr:alpha/beta hydrolase [Desulfarculaceae bacterium]